MTTDEMSRAVELAACPFCGANPVVDDERGMWMIFCGNGSCGCQDVCTAIVPTRDEAIAAWNARTPAGWQDIASAPSEVEYQVWEGDELQASSSSEADGRHYHAVYSQDGPVSLVKATTFRETLIPAPPAKENNDG